MKHNASIGVFVNYKNQSSLTVDSTNIIESDEKRVFVIFLVTMCLELELFYFSSSFFTSAYPTSASSLELLELFLALQNDLPSTI